MPSLLLGCGNSREKKVHLESHPDWVGDLVTLDMDPNCGADVIHDLDVHPLPFEDEQFDELSAFDVLEHLGKQGDWRGFFAEFADYWRILKPGGVFNILVPCGPDALADPGHTRFFGGSEFFFLSQTFYAERLAKGIATTDYRWFWTRDFDVAAMTRFETHHIGVILRKR